TWRFNRPDPRAIVRQAVNIGWGRFASDKRGKVTACGGGDSKTIRCDKLGRQWFFAICHHAERHGTNIPSIRCIPQTLDRHHHAALPCNRELNCGLTNGNPVKALLEDGMPGANIVQIGLAPFANSKRMHETAKAAGIAVFTASDCARRTAAAIFAEALARLAALDAIFVDFDIDVVDRAQMPAAPGARPGGIAVRDFFACARLAGAHPKVRAVDLTEFDPALDVAETAVLTAGRWLCEILAGLAARGRA
ncbi:MAG: arginase family protein, partial [Parvularculaceae bacterium]|nr:arginase family protein [Parvularculaceae bacterium]